MTSPEWESNIRPAPPGTAIRYGNMETEPVEEVSHTALTHNQSSRHRRRLTRRHLHEPRTHRQRRRQRLHTPNTTHP